MAAKVLSRQSSFTESDDDTSGPLFVYVGNLPLDITPARLKAHFADCGAVGHIDLRCSGGRVVAIGQPVTKKAARNLQLYAAVDFEDRATGNNALAMDGTRIDGHRIVVTTEALKLPHAKAFSDRQREETVKQKNGETAPFLNKAKALVAKAFDRAPALQRARTEVVPEHMEPREATPGRAKVFDYSFALDIA